MARFTYEAVSRSTGDSVSGEITAETREAAVGSLNESGYAIYDMRELTEKRRGHMLASRKKVSLSDLSTFSRQLSTMLRSGIPAAKAIGELALQTGNRELSGALAGIVDELKSGTSLSEAFAGYPEIFDSLFLSMLRSGEGSGRLALSLERLANQLKNEKKLRDNIRNATLYPKVVGLFAVILFFVMLVALVPVFERLIPRNAEVPGITRMIFELSASLRSSWYIWISAAAAVCAAVYFILLKGRGMYDRLRFRIPVFGQLSLYVASARFARVLSTMLESGNTITDSLKIAGGTAGSFLMQRAVEAAAARVEQGEPISDAIGQSGLFPPMLISMIQVGEETGKLAALLASAAEYYEDEADNVSRRLSTLLEPLVLILVGIVVGGMLISLYLPMFTSVATYAG